jgi:hypothetical protein
LAWANEAPAEHVEEMAAWREEDQLSFHSLEGWADRSRRDTGDRDRGGGGGGFGKPVPGSGIGRCARCGQPIEPGRLRLAAATCARHASG